MFGCKSSTLAWNIFHFFKALLAITLLWYFVLKFQADFEDLTTYSQCQKCYARAQNDPSSSIYSFTGCSCYLETYTNENSLSFPDACMNTVFLEDCTNQDSLQTCEYAEALPNMQVEGFLVHEQGQLTFFKVALLGSIFLFFLICCSGIAFFACSDHLLDQIFFTSATLSLFCSQFFFIVLSCIYSNLEKDGCFFVDIPRNFLVILSSTSLFNLLLLLFTYIFILLPRFLEFRIQIRRCIAIACFIQGIECILGIIYSSNLTVQLTSFLIIIDWIFGAIYISIQHVVSTPTLKSVEYAEPTESSDEGINKSMIGMKKSGNVLKVLGNYEPISAAENSEDESSSLSEEPKPVHDVSPDVKSDTPSTPIFAHLSSDQEDGGSGLGTIIGQRPDTTKTDVTFAVGYHERLPPPKETEKIFSRDEIEDVSDQLSSSYPSARRPVPALRESTDLSRSFPGHSSTNITENPTSDSSIDSDEFREQYWSKSSISMPKPPVRKHQSFSHNRLIELSNHRQTPIDPRKWSDTRDPPKVLPVQMTTIMQSRYPSREQRKRMSSEDYTFSTVDTFTESTDEFQQISYASSRSSRFDRLVAERRKLSADRSRRFARKRKNSKDPGKWKIYRKNTDPLSNKRKATTIRKGTDPEIYRRQRHRIMRREERASKRQKRISKETKMMKMKPSERRKYRKSTDTREPKISRDQLPLEIVHRHSGGDKITADPSEVPIRDDQSIWSDTTESHIPKAVFGRKPIVGRAKVLQLHE